MAASQARQGLQTSMCAWACMCASLSMALSFVRAV